MTHSSATIEIAVLGCGYVGYPLSLLAAEAGFTVLAVDIDEQIVARVNSGEALLGEFGVKGLASSVAQTGRLRADSTPQPSGVFIIAVPTPLDAAGHRADLSAVAEAARAIVPHLRPGNLVVVESTVPPGTCIDLVAPILEESGLGVGSDLLLAHCPERVHPGATIEELVNVDRIIGGINEEATRAAASLYERFVDANLIETSIAMAEICKLMENTYRDVNIAIANQIAELAEAVGVDPIEAIRIANGHPRVGYLTPGIGVGGHCIPVDPWFLLGNATTDAGVIGAARSVNDRQPHRVARLIADEVEDVESPRILLIGAAYKADVSDTRNSPALEVRDRLVELGYAVETHDPLASEYAGDILTKAVATDLVAILVAHRQAIGDLRANAAQIASLMRRPRILDFSTGTRRPI